MVADGASVDHLENAELFEIYFGCAMESAHIQEAGEQINPSLKNGSQFLTGASQGTEIYESSLEDSLRKIRVVGRFMHQIANAMVFRPKVL